MGVPPVVSHSVRVERCVNGGKLTDFGSWNGQFAPRPRKAPFDLKQPHVIVVSYRNTHSDLYVERPDSAGMTASYKMLESC